jgi:hypothetical protein
MWSPQLRIRLMTVTSRRGPTVLFSLPMFTIRAGVGEGPCDDRRTGWPAGAARPQGYRFGENAGLAPAMQAGERLAHVGWLTADAASA